MYSAQEHWQCFSMALLITLVVSRSKLYAAWLEGVKRPAVVD